MEDIIFPGGMRAHTRASRDWVATILTKGPIKMGTLLNRAGTKNREILRKTIRHMANDGVVVFENFTHPANKTKYTVLSLLPGVSSILPQRGTPVRLSKYPFADMRVGDSVFFEGEKTGGRPYLAARAYGMRSQKKFSGRIRINEDGIKGLRIWRVA